MKLIVSLSAAVALFLLGACAPPPAAQATMCTYAGLDTLPASSPHCVAPPPPPPPPPPPAMCAYSPSILATDEQCVAPFVVVDSAQIGGGPVFFDIGKSTIRPDAVASLQRQIPWLQANPGMRVRLEGNADDPGSALADRSLALHRAAAVKQYLVQQGIASDRFETVSYGNKRPVCVENTRDCKAQNRRVDFRIVTIGADRIVIPPDYSVVSTLDRFPWPPPVYTGLDTIPRRLCSDDRNRTLGGSSNKITDAFKRGGFGTPRIYMVGSDGLAVVGQIEAIADNARLLQDSSKRFIPFQASRTSSFDFREILRELTSRNTGHYRLIVVAVTPKPLKKSSEVWPTTTFQALPTGGTIELPESVKPIPLSTQLPPCYVILYEFERPADPASTHLISPSPMPIRTHLVYAGLWTAAQLSP
jgi:peptidoglycan-associated lipoprotein